MPVEILGAILVAAPLIWGIKKLSSNNVTRNRNGYSKQIKVAGSLASNRSESTPVQPHELYHGTTLQNAFDIYNTGLWLVGTSRPRAVWMADRFRKARGYAGNNGGVVVMRVNSNLKLTNRYLGVYIYKIPNAKPNKEYYQIPGLNPVGVLDSNGNRIR